jgi:hypothetical protein
MIRALGASELEAPTEDPCPLQTVSSPCRPACCTLGSPAALITRLLAGRTLKALLATLRARGLRPAFCATETAIVMRFAVIHAHLTLEQ